MLTLGPGQEPSKPSSAIPAATEAQPNSVPPQTQIPVSSPFSQPPAPPPQQPLPEKPDATRLSMTESVPQQPLRRAEADRSRSVLNSPTKLETPSSQILSLVEALTTANREIDSQSDRLKHLELLLRKERTARENAEERARLMEVRLPSSGAVERGTGEKETTQPPSDSSQETARSLIAGHDKAADMDSASNTAAHSAGGFDGFAEHTDDGHRDKDSIDASTSRLQERLDSMVREMDEMRMTMESYKQRAETAEHERKSLAEIVEQIRAKESHKRTILSGAPTPAESIDGSPTNHSRSWSEHGDSAQLEPFASPARGMPSPPHLGPDAEPSYAGGPDKDLKALQRTISTALHAHGGSHRWVGEGGDAMVQSAPYVSMVGVVLIGVGIMTWLNGWQGGER